MVLNHGPSSLFVVLLAFLLFMINCAEPKQQSSPEIRRLVEIETVDAKGVVRERVVAEYKPTESEGQIDSFKNVRDAKEFLDDDEDSSDNESSGDSETYGESYDMVANDEPMAQSSNISTAESSGLPSKSSNSSVNSTSIPVTDTVASKTSTVVPTKGQINASNSSTITASVVVQTTENIDTTTAVLQTTKPVTTPAVKVTATTGKENVTLPSTPSPITVSTEHTQNITTTLLPKVTEVKTDLESTTTRPTSALTLKSTETTRTTAYTVTEATPLIGVSATTKPNFTEEGINNKTDSKVPAKVRTTQSTPSIGIPAVKGRTGSERRKTLFGFVTIEILIALLAGALFSVLLVAFLVYRLKKRNEGSYELSETIALRPKEIDEMGKKKEVFV